MSVRHALLALLSEGAKYGLQLREEFEAGTGEVWPLNVGQVYTTLQRLERDGLVESDGDGQDGPQKGFRITADGAEELAEWLRTPPDLSLGRALFVKTCAQCHTLYGTGGKVGPDITGSNRPNLDYLLENILDPSAVIPNDYKAMKGGDSMSPPPRGTVRSPLRRGRASAWRRLPLPRSLEPGASGASAAASSATHRGKALPGRRGGRLRSPRSFAPL